MPKNLACIQQLNYSFCPLTISFLFLLVFGLANFYKQVFARDTMYNTVWKVGIFPKCNPEANSYCNYFASF